MSSRPVRPAGGWSEGNDMPGPIVNSSLLIPHTDAMNHQNRDVDITPISYECVSRISKRKRYIELIPPYRRKRYMELIPPYPYRLSM